MKGTCKKVRYGSRGQAWSAAPPERPGQKTPTPYYCRGCRGWHLTSSVRV